DSFSIDLSSEKEGFAEATATFMGLDEKLVTSALPGTVTAAPTLLRPAEALVSIGYNSVTGSPVMSGGITFTRKLKRPGGADGTGIPLSIDLQGKSTLEGKLHIRYLNQTMLTDAVNLTARDINLSLATDANDSITWDMPNSRLNRTPMSISGPDGI